MRTNITLNIRIFSMSMGMLLTEIVFQITPIFHQDKPYIKVMLDDKILYDGLLYKPTKFTYNNTLSIDENSITVEFLNKTDKDCVLEQQLDKAVNIDYVSFFGINSKHSLWNSIYVPKYSEDYLKTLSMSKQTVKHVLTSCSYLGWNGVWETRFSVPVFTWLHKVENLGWIYPK